MNIYFQILIIKYILYEQSSDLFCITIPDVSPAEPEISEASEPPPVQIETQVAGPRIELPRIDDQFESFFSTAESINISSRSLEIKDIDLDIAVTRSSEL